MPFALFMSVLVGHVFGTKSASHLPLEVWIHSLNFIPFNSPTLRANVRSINKMSKIHCDKVDSFRLHQTAKNIMVDHEYPTKARLSNTADYLRYILNTRWVFHGHSDWDHYLHFFQTLMTHFKLGWNLFGSEIVMKLLTEQNDGGFMIPDIRDIIRRDVSDVLFKAIFYQFRRLLMLSDASSLQSFISAISERKGYEWQTRMLFELLSGDLNTDGRMVRFDLRWKKFRHTLPTLIRLIQLQITRRLHVNDEEEVERFLVALVRCNGLDMVIGDGKYKWLYELGEILDIRKVELLRMRNLLTTNVGVISDLPQLRWMISNDDTNNA